MKRQCYINVAITIISLTISAFALANTDLSKMVRVAKFTIPFLPQNSEREVGQARPETNNPLELSEVKIQGKAVRVHEKFLEGSDWIKKTTFKLKNKYSKTITFIQVDIDFPETKTSGIMIQQQLLLGRHPVYGKPKDQQPLNLKPNESMEVSLLPEFDRIKKIIEFRHAQIGAISKMLIRLQDVGFDDGTVYAAGAFYKRNPDVNSSPKWIRIE